MYSDIFKISKHRGKAKKRCRSKNRGYFRGKQSSYRREISKRKKALELGRVFEADPIGVPTSPEIPAHTPLSQQMYIVARSVNS